MRKDLLILALGLFAAAGTAAADDLAVPETQAQAPAPVTLPAKGITMTAVKKQFGEPRGKHGPVGGDTPKHPPITRWDYDGFVVIFEKDRVIDAVVPGAPPRLRTTAGLTRATDAPPPPAMMAPAPAEAPPAETPMEAPAEPAPDTEGIIPESPAPDAPPPMEPSAEAAPVIPEAPAEAPPAEAAPAEAAPAAEPPPAEPAPAPAAPPPAEPDPYADDRPPTPK